MAILTNFGVPVPGASGTTLMPKLQYRFRVTFHNLAGSDKASEISRNIVSVSRPAMDHDDVTIDMYNSKVRLAGKHTWQDITLVIRDDVSSEVVKLLGQQLNTQVDHADQTSAQAGGDYKFGMTIETLDGSQDAGAGAVLDQWHLAGCFIPSLQYGDLNYGTSDAVQITATIRFDNASNHIGAGGVDVLSGGKTKHVKKVSSGGGR